MKFTIFNQLISDSMKSLFPIVQTVLFDDNHQICWFLNAIPQYFKLKVTLVLCQLQIFFCGRLAVFCELL